MGSGAVVASEQGVVPEKGQGANFQGNENVL